ncbi:ISJP4 transposase [Saccharomonospora azurea SZMC 14600]|nr:ISJP4 transposase [Saccharomonospora azurea SZMC 14600]
MRAQDRDHLARATARGGWGVRGDLLAAVAGLDRGRGLHSCTRAVAGPAAGSGSAGSGHCCGGRFACAGLERGAATGPSPVDRARPGSKHHVITDGGGIPLAVTVTGGNRHDSTQLIPLVEALPTIRGKRGRPWRRPRWLYGDRGYDYDHHRKPSAPRELSRGSPARTPNTAPASARFVGLWNARSPGCTSSNGSAPATNNAPPPHALLQLGCALIYYRQLTTSF